MENPQLLPLQRILVIEGDRPMQARLQGIFQPEGYWIELADRGSKGHELLRNPHRPWSFWIFKRRMLPLGGYSKRRGP